MALLTLTGNGRLQLSPTSCLLACELPSFYSKPFCDCISPIPILTCLLQLVRTLGFNHDHTQVVAEDDPPVLFAAALRLAESLLQLLPQPRGGRAQEVFRPCQEIHHAASDQVPLNKALGDIPAWWELVNVVLNTKPLQNICDAAGGDVVAAVGGRQAVSILLP